MLRKSLFLFWLLLALIWCFASGPARAQGTIDSAKPFLHPLFADNTVLQRGMADPIWGWTEPGKQVTVSMNGKHAAAIAGPDGKWMARIGPFRAGGPYTMTVDGPTSVTLNNVMVGDVWICSGQSNMEFGIGNLTDARQEIANANYPDIHLLMVPRSIATQPQETTDAPWLVCTPENVAKGGWNGFSAVGYLFGRELYNRLHVPIGLIESSWGGTVAEAWVSPEALNTIPDFRAPIVRLRQAALDQAKPGYSFDAAVAAWWVANDPGSAVGAEWWNPTLDTTGWKTMSLPTNWEKAGLPDFDGLVWFRRTFDLPAGWEGKDIDLHLARIDDRDTTWVNGVRVGATNDPNVPRRYRIAANLLKPTGNVIAVRVYDTGGLGGLSGDAADMYLRPAGDSSTTPLSLTGDWVYRAATPMAQLQPEPQRVHNENNVTVLYNGMIAPLIPYGIKGVTWYQGESNAGRGKQYRTLLPTLIGDWRSRFGEGDFPFLVVQLANWLPVQDQPGESGWAEVREAQAMTAKNVANVGLALAVDIGDAVDIHPKNKQEVARRLALNAMAIAYGQDVDYSGPVFRKMKIKGNEARLTFDHADGIAFKGDKPLGFAVAGADKKFVWADARIEGRTVVVSSPQVPHPVAVRYAWADNPLNNLYNGAGLPAVPFRTDSD